MGAFDNYKFHCSSLGKLMTEPRSKKDGLGETCKKKLIECYVGHKYRRRKDIRNRYMEKGLQVEEAAITLYSRVCKKFFKKNEEQFSNEFIVGTPDIIKNVRDIKSSWDLHTFYAPLAEGMNKDYWWQLQGYMDLLDDEEAQLIYVLIDTPEALIQQQMYWLRRDMGVLDGEINDAFNEGCAALVNEMTFSDIPIDRRYHEHTFKRDREAMAACYEKLKLCREFLNNLP